MEEIDVADMIEPIEEPMWHYDGGRSSGKSYFEELLRSKDKEIERLNNIMRPEKADYDYIALLFEKKSKEEVIKAFVYKCEQLQNLYKSYEDKEIEARKKDNIITELEEYIKPFLYMLNGITDKDVYEQCQLDDFTMIMEKLQELKGGVKE